jgi:AraC-like DNA-binding protein
VQAITIPESQVRSEGRSDGIERFSAYFQGFSYSPHRHDNYAVGVTTAGVQCFDYRGEARGSTCGQAFVLHPDERHDGRAGDDRGFGYRIAYIDPSLIRDAAGRAVLPFVADPVSNDPTLVSAIMEVLDSPFEEDEMAEVSSISALAQALVRLSTWAPSPRSESDKKGVAAARAALVESAGERLSLAELECISGMSRWQLSRQFRELFGVSPYRFQLQRRLDVPHGAARARRSFRRLNRRKCIFVVEDPEDLHAILRDFLSALRRVAGSREGLRGTIALLLRYVRLPTPFQRSSGASASCRNVWRLLNVDRETGPGP